MNDIALFPVWQKVQDHPKLPIFYRRALWVGPSSSRAVVACLSLVSDQARLVLRIEEPGCPVLPVLSKPADGISSLSRAIQWAEWVISDFEAGSAPRKRSRKSPKLATIEKEAA